MNSSIVITSHHLWQGVAELEGSWETARNPTECLNLPVNRQRLSVNRLWVSSWLWGCSEDPVWQKKPQMWVRQSPPRLWSNVAAWKQNELRRETWDVPMGSTVRRQYAVNSEANWRLNISESKSYHTETSYLGSHRDFGIPVPPSKSRTWRRNCSLGSLKRPTGGSATSLHVPQNATLVVAFFSSSKPCSCYKKKRVEHEQLHCLQHPYPTLNENGLSSVNWMPV